MPLPRALVALPGAVVLVAAIAGCTQKAAMNADGGATITVTATDQDCSLSASTIASGTTTFSVKNTGTKVTEFYLSSGDKVIGEVENIAPGLTRSLSVALKPGSYTTLCKPGETGSGVGRSTLKVTGAAAAPAAERTRTTADFSSRSSSSWQGPTG